MKKEDVIQIRERYASGKYRQQDLAEEYGVHVATIGGIVNGSRYKKVGGPITVDQPCNLPRKVNHACGHSDRPHCANGLCRQCYDGIRRKRSGI